MACPHHIRDALAFLCLANGWHAIEANDRYGTVQLWLLNPAGEAGNLDHVLPDHEMTGPLPADVAGRVWQL